MSKNTSYVVPGGSGPAVGDAAPYLREWSFAKDNYNNELPAIKAAARMMTPSDGTWIHISSIAELPSRYAVCIWKLAGLILCAIFLSGCSTNNSESSQYSNLPEEIENILNASSLSEDEITEVEDEFEKGKSLIAMQSNAGNHILASINREDIFAYEIASDKCKYQYIEEESPDDINLI